MDFRFQFMGLSALIVAAGMASMAQAEGPRLLGCYQKVLVPAEYDVTKTLVKKAERKYVKRNGRYELLEYPAVYQEHKKLVKSAYYVMREVSCD